MKHEKYNYSSANVPTLKRKIRWNALFSILMIAVLLLEVFMLLNAYKSKIELSIVENIVSIATMLFALSFVLVQLGSLAKNLALISKIKKDGFVEYDTLLMNFDKKMSFGNVFRIFEYCIFWATAVVVAGFTTFAVLKYIYASQINYYIPLLLTTVITSHYSCKNVDTMYTLKKG